jgi:mRNA-decapping enzyme subunit 2
VLHDVFIYPPPEGGDSSTPKYLIEVDKEQVRTLMKHLKKYKLRAKLTLRALDEGEYSVWAAWDENSGTVGTKQDQAAQKSLPIACEDKRAPGFGSRIIAAGDFREKADYLPGQPVSLETYHLRRILHGIPEGQGEIVSGEALPLNCNMDIMGGVDFHKGCYVGQELTIRTHHRGVVQKRLLPVQLYNFNEQKPENETPVYDDEANLSVPRPHTPMTKVEVEGQAPGAAWRRPARPGTFICGIGNVGLATCGIEMMTDLALSDVAKQYDPDQEFQVTWTATSGNAEAVKVKAFIPPWTREYLLSRGARERTPVGEAQRAREIADEVESELQRYEGSDKQ